MLAVHAEIGQRYAYREPPFRLGDRGRPAEVVRLGPPKSQKVKVRWLDGDYVGLEEWVLQRRLAATLDEIDALVADELSHDDLWKHSEADPFLSQVVYAVLGAIPAGLADDLFLDQRTRPRKAVLEGGSLDALVAFVGLQRAELLAEPHAFVDRRGAYFATIATAEKIARICCARYSDAILREIAADEQADRDASITGFYLPPAHRVYAEPHAVDRERQSEKVRAQEAVFAQIREWCGWEATMAFDRATALGVEIDRLRRLVAESAVWLEEAGHPQKAKGLLKKLNQGADLGSAREVLRAESGRTRPSLSGGSSSSRTGG